MKLYMFLVVKVQELLAVTVTKKFNDTWHVIINFAHFLAYLCNIYLHNMCLQFTLKMNKGSTQFIIIKQEKTLCTYCGYRVHWI